MPISADRKARTRAEIFDHAARLFRLRGYAGTNIDDIMLAAGLTRGAFYAHFESKDQLFAEVVGAGHGLLAVLRASDPKTALNRYFDKTQLTANAQACTLAALPTDVARAPLAARLAYANMLYALIEELSRGRARKLDASATTVAILAVGALVLARASGDTRLSDWLLRCARRTALPLLKPRASPSRKRSRSRRKVAAARRPRRAARSRAGRA
ncbi:transcriptional regulator, TetR family [Enhydrobacter aerosaccus]|uniref:Transcriptional regulator, TetR family n=1 Tax=Enhydrobacter aerosaccus TaxID=225324 RepID=A0A1T4L364_9HYPH|nr:TetR family transcriptional regulator [Enhydrobacter aerosaccus]SJZ49159.1 transcriptional regulator, TetR family [Enhydrobacter aerosaccus]